MLCKVCNTRISGRRSSCPNCGSHQVFETIGGESAATKLPDIEIPHRSAETVDDAVELAFDDAASLELDEAVDDREPSPPPVIESNRVQARKEPEPVSQPARRIQTNRPLGVPDAAAIRSMLAGRPDMLEPGLSVYTSEKGTPLGAGYTSAVGEIDLLARDAKGDLVVVMVAEREEGADVISVMLQRIGWVRRHLSRESRPVRGIVLMDEVRDGLTYAAAAVSDTIAFKTYRVALAFEDAEF